MSKLSTISAAILVLIIAGIIAYSYFRTESVSTPAKAETSKSEIVKIIKRVETKPDGTTITTDTEVKKTKESKVVKPDNRKWLVGPSYNFESKKYGAEVNYKILPNVFVGGSVEEGLQNPKVKVLILF